MLTEKELRAKQLEVLEQIKSFDGTPEESDDLNKRADDIAGELENMVKNRDEREERRKRLEAISPEQVVAANPNAVTAPSAPGQYDQRRQQPEQDWAQRAAKSMTEGYSGKGTGPTAQMPYEMRALLDQTGYQPTYSATGAGVFYDPARPAMIPLQYNDRILRVADIIDRGQTNSNGVEFVRDDTAAGAGSAAEVTEGSAKPESTYSFSVQNAPVATVAHWMQVTRQALDDNAILESYLRGRMTYGLKYRLDGQIINGNGTAPNMRGILATSGINTVAPTSEARVISIRRAITSAQNQEYQPSAVVLNPSDWELVELSQDSTGEFRVSPNVANALGPRIWGLQVITSTAIASGTGLVGDFNLGATLWDRQDVTAYLTDSHASNFVSNILVLLMELRAALTVWRPKAFTKITFGGTV